MTPEDEEFNRIEREAKQRMEAVSAALNKKAENARELGLDYEPAQQEPVAWMNPHGGMLTANYIDNFASGLDKEIHSIPLYTSPQPAQRTWVGLTPEELDEMFSKTLKGKKLVNWVAKAIEAKLRSKNEDRN